jgi:hypothetical protein
MRFSQASFWFVFTNSVLPLAARCGRGPARSTPSHQSSPLDQLKFLVLMGLKNPGEFRAYFKERFSGIVDLTVRGSLKTNSPVPIWAGRRIREAWNVQ